MKAAWPILISCLCLSPNSALLGAQAAGSFVPNCAPSSVDVHALPPVLTEGEAGHLFVLEIQNIGAAPCMLAQPAVELLPPSDPNNNLYQAAIQSEDGPSEWGPTRLEPGEWAHVLFAWISRSAPENRCNHYSELKLHIADLNPNFHLDDKAAIDVRNLWIRSCPSVYVSGYRKGRYSPQSRPGATWLKWEQPAVAGPFRFPEQPAASQVLASSPLLAIHAFAARTMLNDYLQLRFKFPRSADSGCAFRLLRKRQPSGATVISVQQCLAAGPVPVGPVPRYLEPGILRLDMRALDMLPLEPGPVEYEVVGAIASSGPAPFARAHIHLVARDPSPPAQAPVVVRIPACKASQLQVASPHPVLSTTLQTLRVYEAENSSPEACSVAGVPSLEFVDDNLNPQFVPEPCPNCDNQLFKTRPNGRIDLKPGGAAHFLVGATAIDTQEDPWMHCEQTAKLRLTVTAEEKPIVLPLGAGACATVDVSAWRAGAFDGDPQNLRWAKTHDRVFAGPAAPVPPDCNKPELLTRGRPFMIPSQGPVAWGLSFASPTFIKGQPIPLHLWLDNSSDQPAFVWTCMDLDFFKINGLDLYDAYGHRVLSRRDLALKAQCANPHAAAIACSRNFQIQIPPHTCVNGDDYDFTAQLADQYDLPQGEYTVHLRAQGKEPGVNFCAEPDEPPFVPTPGTDLTFDVLQP